MPIVAADQIAEAYGSGRAPRLEVEPSDVLDGCTDYRFICFHGDVRLTSRWVFPPPDRRRVLQSQSDRVVLLLCHARVEHRKRGLPHEGCLAPFWERYARTAGVLTA